jgi:hypothetical protein
MDARDRAYGLCYALHRVRDASDAFVALFTFQTAHLVPAARFCARGLQPCSPRIEGRAERRETFGCVRGTRWACRSASKTRVNALMTRHARRLRGALRPMTRDARLSALHRGDFSPGAALPSPALSSGSVQRAPRSQVVVPGGRLPGPPGASSREPPRRTPRLAPPSGSSLEDAPR